MSDAIDWMDPRLCAIHESGHALAGHACRRRVVRVWLRTDPVEGLVTISQLDLRGPDDAETELLISAAGCIAEALHLDVPLTKAFAKSGHGDLANMKRIHRRAIRRSGPNPTLGDAGLATATLICRQHFDAIEALAEALLAHGELPGAFVHDLFRVYGVPRRAFGRWINHISDTR